MTWATLGVENGACSAQWSFPKLLNIGNRKIIGGRHNLVVIQKIMEIRCWGSRGSVPVSGKQVARYGGDTTCIQITSKSKHQIILDAGTGIRRLGNYFINENLTDYHLIFTHAHWDHVMGIPFFRPFQYKKVNVIVQDRTFNAINTEKMIDQVMRPPFFPIGIEDLNANITFDKSLNGRFTIGSIDIESIPLSHPGGGTGYKLTEDGKSFVFLTDNELMFRHPDSVTFEEYVDFCKGADLLLHDTEYTDEEYHKRQGWGHSAMSHVLDLSIKAGVKKLGLFHLSQDRSDDEVDLQVSQIRDAVQKAGAPMDCFAVSCDWYYAL